MAKKQAIKRGGFREEARGLTGPKLRGSTKRVQLSCTVDTKTREAIDAMCLKEGKSIGQLIDQLFS